MFLNIDKHNPNNVALQDELGRKETYGELVSFCNDVKGMVPSGSVVLIISENSTSYVSFFIACIENGIIPLVVGSEVDDQLLSNLFNTYRPQYIFQSKEVADQSGRTIIKELYDAVLVKTEHEYYKTNSKLALLLPTSGSTGSPKLVRHSKRNLESSAQMVSESLGIDNSHKPLLILPFHYTMGMSVVTSNLFAGASVFLTRKSLTDRSVWSCLQEEQINSITGVPFSFQILNKLRFFRSSWPDLKYIYQGGGKLSTDLFRTLCDYTSKHNKVFIATYGQTEATARMSYLPPDQAANKVCSIGVSMPKGSFSLLLNNGKISVSGEAQGELIYEGPNVTMGYASSIADLLLDDDNQGLLYTGDIAFRDADNFYYIIGRKSRFLKLFGLRIGLDEVEHLIKSSFPVDCFCTGTDEKLVVNINNSDYSDQVRDLLSKKLSLFHKAFEVKVVEQISRSKAGKVIYSQ